MIYSKQNIVTALDEGVLEISPAPESGMFDTSAVDLRLGNQFTTFANSNAGSGIIVTIGESQAEQIARQRGTIVEIEQDGYLELNAGEFVLGWTMESVRFPRNLAARVEGKSSIARFGLSVHQTAPTIHADFEGEIRLEIANLGPFLCRLKPATRICQLIIEELKTPATESIPSQFQGQSA